MKFIQIMLAIIGIGFPLFLVSSCIYRDVSDHLEKNRQIEQIRNLSTQHNAILNLHELYEQNLESENKIFAYTSDKLAAIEKIKPIITGRKVVFLCQGIEDIRGQPGSREIETRSPRASPFLLEASISDVLADYAIRNIERILGDFVAIVSVTAVDTLRDPEDESFVRFVLRGEVVDLLDLQDTFWKESDYIY